MKPEHPHDAGIPELEADSAHNEGAYLLAEEARSQLEPIGFTWDEILEWSKTYLETEGSGDLDSFLAWIDQQEAGRRG